MTYRYNYEYGLSLAAMANIESLIKHPPYQEPFESTTVEVDAASGLIKGHGWGQTGLSWGFISQADRNSLKGLVPGRSQEMYWRVLDDFGNWVYCKTVTIWPSPEPEPQTGRLLGFKLELRIEEVIGASSS